MSETPIPTQATRRDVAELRCNGCGALVGTTTRPQPVPVRCTSVYCVGPDVRQLEERDALLTFAAQRGAPLSALAEAVGVSRPRVSKVVSS